MELILFSSISLFALLLHAQVDSQQVQLNMYQNSFDDQYVGCVEEMDALLPELLQKERNQNTEYRSTWDSALQTWAVKKSVFKSLPKYFLDEHGTAILTYTNMSSLVYKNLNRGIRDYGASPEKFKYHSLHYYLTRALTLLRASCNGNPWNTYRGASKIVFEPPIGPELNIRLGQFASSSTDIKQAESFGNASFFTITTCFGANIQNFSYFPEQKEVLIPMDEMFYIYNYTKEGNIFVLKSINNRCSYYNCAYLGGSKRETCTYNSAPVLLSFSTTLTTLLLSGFFFI